MAMDQVSVTQEGMTGAAQEFGNVANEFIGYLQNINSEMATLQSTWAGQASGAFNQAMDGWESNFKIIIDQLLGLMESMGVNTQNYTANEEAAVGTAGQWATFF